MNCIQSKKSDTELCYGGPEEATGIIVGQEKRLKYGSGRQINDGRPLNNKCWGNWYYGLGKNKVRAVQGEFSVAVVRMSVRTAHVVQPKKLDDGKRGCFALVGREVLE